MKLLIFQTDGQQFAIPTDCVDQVVQAVDITSLPNTPEYISGIINYHGNIIPVLNTRKLFVLSQRELKAKDQFIIIKTETAFMALWVDATRVVENMKEDKFIDIKQIQNEDRYVKGVFKLEKEIIILNDVDKFLDKKELLQLENALKKVKSAKES